MNKFFAAIVILFVFSSCCLCFAENTTIEELYSDTTKQFYKDMPNSVKDTVSDTGVINIGEKIKSLFEDTFSDLSEMVKKPLKLLGVLISVMLILSAVSGFSDSESSNKAGRIVSGLVAAVSLASFTGEYFADLGETLESLKNLAVSFVPAFAGVCSGAGMVTASVGYSAAALLSTQAVCVFVAGISKPLLGIMMALSVAGGTIDWFDTTAFVKSISKIIKWVFSVGSTAFVIITTLQSTVASSVDTATLAAGRFMFSSVIPVVGSSFSESGAAVLSSLKVVKGNIGAAGIIGIAAIALPVIIRYLCFALSLKLASGAGALLGQTSISKMIDGVYECIVFCAAAIASSSLMLIFMTAVMITTGNL